jgi:hypothetical protein
MAQVWTFVAVVPGILWPIGQTGVTILLAGLGMSNPKRTGGKIFRWMALVVLGVLGVALTWGGEVSRQRETKALQDNVSLIGGQLKQQGEQLELMSENDQTLTLAARAQLLALRIDNFRAQTDAHRPWPTAHGDTSGAEWMQYNNTRADEYEKLFGGKIVNMRRELLSAGIPENELWQEWEQTMAAYGGPTATAMSAAAERLKRAQQR